MRCNFNPSADKAVEELKKAAADLIDMVDSLPEPSSPALLAPFKRRAALAATAAEEAAMWAVKAATIKHEEIPDA